MSRDAERTDPGRRQIAGPVFGLALCVLVWGSLLTFDAGDWPSTHQYPHNDPAANACGRLGGWVAYHLFYYIGDGAYVAALFALCASVTYLIRGRIESPIQRYVRDVRFTLIGGGTSEILRINIARGQFR